MTHINISSEKKTRVKVLLFNNYEMLWSFTMKSFNEKVEKGLLQIYFEKQMDFMLSGSTFFISYNISIFPNDKIYVQFFPLNHFVMYVIPSVDFLFFFTFESEANWKNKKKFICETKGKYAKHIFIFLEPDRMYNNI